jgi:hypothetical protein
MNQQRDTELENIVGNLLIAEYQLEKLKQRLVGRIGSAYPSLTNKRCLRIYSKTMVVGLKFQLMWKAQ